MNKIDEADKAVLLWKTPYLVEAYSIFYGKYPNFSNNREGKEKNTLEFQLMINILSEYNILNEKYEWCYDSIENVPYSTKVNYQINLLTSKISNIIPQESILDEICYERPLSEEQKRGIKAISYLIKKQINEENEEYLNFLKQICNVNFFRKSIVFPITQEEDFATVFSKNLSSGFPQLGISKTLAKERHDFITSKLRLLIHTSPVSVNRVIKKAEQEGMDDNNVYGLSIKQHSYCKVLKK